MGSRSWQVRIKAPAGWINANDRVDRRGDPRRRLWRDAGCQFTRAARVPRLGKAHITAVLHFTNRIPRDPHNYYPTLKAVIDGMVKDYGMLPDDSSAYLVGPDIRMGELVAAKKYGPAGELVLTIREMV